MPLSTASELTATIASSTAEIPAAVWNALVPGVDGRPDNPFLDHAFFLAAEQSGSATRKTGWQPQHILLSEAGGEPIGLMPLFLKSHSQGEYVFDHGWAQAYERAGGDYYPKLLSAIPFTPVTAPKLWVPSRRPRGRDAPSSAPPRRSPQRINSRRSTPTSCPRTRSSWPASPAGWCGTTPSSTGTTTGSRASTTSSRRCRRATARACGASGATRSPTA